MRAAIIENGVVVNVIEVESLDAMPGLDLVHCPNNNPGDLWDGVAFSEKQAPLADVKAAKLREIERGRDADRYANVTAHGRPWQSDPLSQNLIGQAITLGMAGVPLPPVWRDANNNDMVITGIADLLAIAGAMAQATQVAYAKSWALKAQVNAAGTAASVESVQW